MWRLPLPHVQDPDLELLRALTLAEGRCLHTPSPNQIAGLLRLYSEYDAALGRPSSSLLGTKLGRRFLGALHDAYDQVYAGRRLGDLRDRLKVAVRTCPYCGFGEVRELDHHLPRSIYRALAIYARNLVPCCHTCNNKKSALASDNPTEQFAHAYFEGLFTERFLLATIDVSQTGGLRAEFSISRPPQMSEELHHRIVFQFSRLDLNARYQPEVNTFMISQRSAIEMAAETGSDSLRAFLERTRANYEKDFGLNDWHTALVDALSSSDDFCNGGYSYCFGMSVVGR